MPRPDVFFALFLSTLLCASAIAQTPAAARPDRGAVTGAAYSVSDVESVSLTNGNVSLSIPLASLPPVAGGKLSWTLSATYNSKLWNVVRRQEDYGGDFAWSPYTVDEPQLSDLAGWQVGGAFRVEIRNARDDFEYAVPPQGAIPDWDRQQLLTTSWYKVVLLTPDGAERELRPVGHASYDGTQDHLRGYFAVLPSASSPVKYYSFDGTFMSAVIKGAGDWTLFMADGTQVVQTSDGVQRIKDTNGNSVKIFSDSSGTHYQDEQTGREVKITYDPAANGGDGRSRVWYQTAGGGWASVEVNWGWTRVRGKSYEVNDWTTEGESGGGVCRRDVLLQETYVRVVREIVFPQTEPGAPGRRFTFAYNSDSTESFTLTDFRPFCRAAAETHHLTASKGWGQLSRMVTPSGAEVRYSYALAAAPQGTLQELDEIAREAVTRKEVEHDGTIDAWTYQISSLGTGGAVANPDGTWAGETAYPHSPGMGYSLGKAGLVYRSSSHEVVVERRWAELAFDGANTQSPAGAVSFNPVVVAEYTTLTDAQGNALKMSARTFARDYNGNVTEVREYDWFDPIPASGRDAQGVPLGVPGSAALLRTTATSYHHSPGSSASSPLVYAKRTLTTGTPSLLGAPKETAAGPSVTRLSYDGQAYGAAPTAGNVTQVSRLDDKGDANASNDTWVSTSTAYGLYGNPSSTTDPNGNVTQFFYDDQTHALPTRVVVDPLNGTGQQTTTTAYDFHTGLVTSTTDPNGQTSEISYVNQLTGAVDPFGRPGVSTGPAVLVDGVSHRQKVFTFYEDAARRARVESDLFAEGDRLLKSRETRDQLGRVVLSEQNEGGAGYTISSQAVYLQAGRVTMGSRPRRAGEAQQPDGWARTTLDEAGRVVEVVNFKGTAQPPSAGTNADWLGSVLTAYHAQRTTVTDQQGRARRSVADALGRLVRVDEPDKDTGALDAAGGSPVQPTHYTYDALGNLRKVDQGGQHRYFLYDSLSRLVRAKNPEQGATTHAEVAPLTDPLTGNQQWSVAYSYDGAGNLAARYDARDVKTSYVYDGLNRNTTVDYSDTLTISPDVTRTYDGATLGKGRLWHNYAGGSEAAGTTVQDTVVDAYDALGRPLAYRQRFKTGGAWNAPYSVSRTYTLSGAVKTQTYPSGRAAAYSYDAAGRLASFTGNLGDGQQRTYSTGAAYDAAGRMTREQFGTDTPLYNKRSYNVAGQLTQIRVGTYHATDQSWWNRGAIINHYTFQQWAGDGSDNNGNLKAQDIYVPHDEQLSGHRVATQRYDYDYLNRLKSVVEAEGGSDRWAQVYEYDRWGNRAIDAAATQVYGQNPTYSIPEPQFDERDLAATNRLYAPGDMDLPEPQRKMRYDGAGHLTQDLCHDHTTLCGRTYDAEGRMTTAQVLSGQVQTLAYAYDADGRRVKRGTLSGEVWQVYGMDGELLAEYAPNADASAPRKEYGYRAGELLVTLEAGPRTNVALASAGATASASSTLDANRPAAAAINGDRRGLHWGSDPSTGSGWHCSTNNGYPDWLEITFGGPKAIDEVSVFTLQDSYLSPSEPTGAMTFTQYGVTDFEVQYWDGAAWATVQGGSVSGNNKVWRRFALPTPVTTTKIRVVVTGALAGYSRVTEVEAWEAPGARMNVAAASAGAVSTASSTLDAGRGPLAAVNGDRKGGHWGSDPASGSGWHDATQNSYPDWLQVDFAGSRMINEVSVFSVQDNYQSPAEPTEQMTFSQYGLVDFHLEYWTGAAWAQVPGGIVSGNNLVWRKVTFAPVTTQKLRVVVTGGQGGHSRVAEVEAYEPAASGADVRWLVSDHLGTPRMVFDRTGSLTSADGQSGMRRHDYFPFGEEIGAGVGGRTTAQGYVSDNLRHRYTTYERDAETGLDYAQNRYYSPATGRFTSADEPLADQNADEPQSWNLYTYGRNNPLRYTDPNGRGIFERIKNALKYGECFCSNEEMQKLENIRRQELRELNLHIRDANGNWVRINVDKLSRRHIFEWHREYRIALNHNQVIQLTDQQVAAAANLPSVTALPTASNAASLRPEQVHHYATNKHKVYTPKMERIVKKYGLDLDGDWNKELLAHQGRHPTKYHQFVLRGMQRAAREAGKDRAKFLELYEKYVKAPVRQNPDLLRSSGWK